MAQAGHKTLPVGRGLRAVLGVVMAVEGGRHLAGSSPALGAWTLGVVAGEVLIYVAIHLAIARFTPSINRWVGAILAVAPVVVIYVAGGQAAQLGTLLFLGVSLVLTAVRNDAGCEVMALPGLMLGRRTHLVCLLFCPVDWLEASVRHRWQSARP